MDPEFFTIEQMKEMGMWPAPDMVSHGLIPYIRRLHPKEEKKRVLFVGMKNGEDVLEIAKAVPNAYMTYIMAKEIDENRHKGIFEYNGKLDEYKNIEQERLIVTDDVTDKDEFDVIIIDRMPSADELYKFYQTLRPLGIFSGNMHDQHEMKVALAEFRRPNKISTPIHIAHNHIWFWVKP